ncbi:hypothetical protein V491_00671 [Pseudogymnoascus sp. VKM F-3775]|nr:hypothetical protein V491_00671 [Pseudogymnoascus sp. VKM F-3775]
MGKEREFEGFCKIRKEEEVREIQEAHNDIAHIRYCLYHKETHVPVPTEHEHVVAGGPPPLNSSDPSAEIVETSTTVPGLRFEDLDADLQRCIEVGSGALEVPFRLLSTIDSFTV